MTTPPARRLRWLLPLLLVLALLAVGGVAWARSDDRPRAEVGAIFDPPFLQDEIEDAVDVVLPWARTTVAVGEPKEELPDVLGADPNLRAPEDGSFVAVQVTVDPEARIPVYVDSPGFVGRADLTLLDGERRYPLTHVPAGFGLDPARPELGVLVRYLAVEGSPEEWSLEVEYDGETWVVDLADGSSDPGPQDLLADLPTLDGQGQQQPSRRCGEPKWQRGWEPEEAYNQAKCRVLHQQRVPYVDGLGWAKPGREFLVVQVESYEPGHVTGPGGSHYLARNPELSYRLDGEEPLAVAGVNELGGPLSLQLPYDPNQAIFDVAVEQRAPVLQVRQTLVGEATDQGDPQGPRFSIDWRVPMEGA